MNMMDHTPHYVPRPKATHYTIRTCCSTRLRYPLYTGSEKLYILIGNDELKGRRKHNIPTLFSQSSVSAVSPLPKHMPIRI